MQAMKAAMDYRKQNNLGKMTYAKGHFPVKKAVAPTKAYGQGIAGVAGMGEQALAKQLSDDNEARTQSVLPEHNVEPRHTKTQAQMANEEIGNNDREADAMLPEHNRFGARKTQNQIRGEEIKYNSAHADAVMPAASKHLVQGLHLKVNRASMAKSEEAVNAKRADAIVPEHNVEKKARTQSQIRKSEETYNAKHADAMLPEHNVEGIKKATQAQIRNSEEQYNAKVC